jgi:hypothetical protein
VGWAGCGGTSAGGVYVLKGSGGTSSIDLKADGTFTASQPQGEPGGGDSSGTWTVSGDEVKLQYTTPSNMKGFDAVLILKGNTLRDGTDVYVLQH